MVQDRATGTMADQ